MLRRLKRVSVSAEQAADGVRLTVADNGPGVPPGEHANLHRRFYRLDQSRSTPAAGLGLTLTSAIAELHSHPLAVTENASGLRVSAMLEAARPA